MFVSANGEKTTLGDLEIVGYADRDEYNESPVVASTLDEFGRTETTYLWVDWVEEEESWYGWYDENGEEPQNDVELKLGHALWVQSPSTNFKLQSKGAISKLDIAVALRDAGGLMLATNPFPSDYKLGDTQILGYANREEYNESPVVASTLDEFGRTETTYLWVDWVEDEESWYGWYDENGEEECNDVVMPMGTALWIQSPSSKYMIQFSSIIDK